MHRSALAVLLIPLVLAVGSGTRWRAAAPPATATTKASLTLSPPRKRTRPGLAFVVATVTMPKADSRVRIVWDVESVFDDDSVTADWEARDSGRRLQIVIPDCSGIVRVSALAIVDGEPTDDKLSKTLIEVSYAPRKPPTKPTPTPTQVDDKPAVTGKVTDVWFLVDPESGDPNVNALVASVGLRNKLRAIGVTPHVFEAGSGATVRRGWERRPAGTMLLTVASGRALRVQRAMPIPATVARILASIASGDAAHARE